MRKLLLLTLACIVWIGSGPRAASAACGREDVRNDVIARPTHTALLQGILEELPLVRCPRPAGWMLHADGRQFYVDFGTNAQLLAKAKKLHKMPVEIGGTLADTGKTEWIDGPRVPPDTMAHQMLSRVRIVHVWSLTPLAEPEGTPVEFAGILRYAELESYPPIPVWSLRIGKGGSYNLRFNSESLAERARRFKNARVTVIGKLGKDNTITVTGLVQEVPPLLPRPGIPQEILPFIIKPAISK